MRAAPPTRPGRSREPRIVLRMATDPCESRAPPTGPILLDSRSSHGQLPITSIGAGGLRSGHRIQSECDSEIIAVYLSERMAQASLELLCAASRGAPSLSRNVLHARRLAWLRTIWRKLWALRVSTTGGDASGDRHPCVLDRRSRLRPDEGVLVCRDAAPGGSPTTPRPRDPTPRPRISISRRRAVFYASELTTRHQPRAALSALRGGGHGRDRPHPARATSSYLHPTVCRSTRGELGYWVRSDRRAEIPSPGVGCRLRNMMSGFVVIEGNAGSLTGRRCAVATSWSMVGSARARIDIRGGTIIVRCTRRPDAAHDAAGRQISAAWPGLGDSLYTGHLSREGRVAVRRLRPGSDNADMISSSASSRARRLPPELQNSWRPQALQLHTPSRPAKLCSRIDRGRRDRPSSDSWAQRDLTPEVIDDIHIKSSGRYRMRGFSISRSSHGTLSSCLRR